MPVGAITPSTTNADEWLNTQKLIDDSMANKVTELTAKDSPLNQMAATEGLKIANRRGLLNSSMAVGEAQDAVLKNVLPIASQDAAQAFQKNQAAKAFEYGMTAQSEAQQFTGGQAELDRNLQQALQTQQINSQQLMQLRQIASTEGIEAANRQLQQVLQQRSFGFQTTQAALDRAMQTKIASWNVSAATKNAVAQFVSNLQVTYQANVQSIMANTALTAAQRTQQLTSAKNWNDRLLNIVEQIFNVDLKW